MQSPQSNRGGYCVDVTVAVRLILRSLRDAHIHIADATIASGAEIKQMDRDVEMSLANRLGSTFSDCANTSKERIIPITVKPTPPMIASGAIKPLANRSRRSKVPSLASR